MTLENHQGYIFSKQLYHSHLNKFACRLFTFFFAFDPLRFFQNLYLHPSFFLNFNLKVFDIFNFRK